MAVPEMAMPVAAMTVATMSVPVSVTAMTMVATMPVAVSMAAVSVAAVSVAAVSVAAVSVAAVSVAALGLCRNVSRGHQQTGYANGRETIDADQCGCCQAARQESTNFAFTAPSHFITSFCTLLLSLLSKAVTL
jgi:membrane protein implicated in regulation of membrane protease activity